MKRCPLCEFIYEDDQSLCEMDGIALVHDNAALPALGGPEDTRAAGNDAIEKPRPKKSRARQLTALLVGILLLLLNYSSTKQAAKTPPNPSTPPASLAPIVAIESVERAAAEKPPSIVEPLAQEKPTSIAKRQERVARNSISSPAVAPARTKVPRAERKPPEKDSKVGGLLKKTGRILSKPFKF